MALLFVGGVMNLLWIAALAILVLFEKLVPIGRLVARLMGLVFIVCGVWLLVHNGAAQKLA
jgi:predicted metal-binding membrane protein